MRGCVQLPWIFFFFTFTCLPVSWWVIYKCTCSHLAECSAVFDQKWHDRHAPPSLFTWSCPKQLFFLFPWVIKVLKGKHFASMKEVKQKVAEALKGIKIDEFKTILIPGWCGSVDWVLACEPKRSRFDSQSGHTPGLQARSPVGGAREAATHWYFSPSLSPSLPLSLKINK